MVQYHTSIPQFLVAWIGQQKVFFVASAPLSPAGHVNLSPKGFENTFHIADENKVWYEDLSGSGVETISHIRENGRLVIMFCAFEGPPRIVRLWGTGTVHEFDTPEYNALIPLQKRQPGSRSVIALDVQKVSTSCGYSIPFFTFKTHRMKLHNMVAKMEVQDIEAETCASGQTSLLPDGGLKSYWKEHNQKSLDGLPGLLSAFDSLTTFAVDANKELEDRDDESNKPTTTTSGAAVSTNANTATKPGISVAGRMDRMDRKLLVGFIVGWLMCFIWMRHPFDIAVLPDVISNLLQVK